MTTDDIRQSAQEMLRATLSAEDGAGSDLAVYRMEEDGEWAEVQGFLDMGHLASEVVAWASERANREPSDAEMVERGARAVAALDWDAEHGGVDPSDEEIARAVLSAALGAQEVRNG